MSMVQSRWCSWLAWESWRPRARRKARRTRVDAGRSCCPEEGAKTSQSAAAMAFSTLLAAGILAAATVPLAGANVPGKKMTFSADFLVAI